MSKEQIRMWSQRPLAQTHTPSLSGLIFGSRSLPTVCVMTAKVLPQHDYAGGIIPKTNACCGFYYSYNVFSPFMPFFYHISPVSVSSNISPFSSHTFVFNITAHKDQK